MRYDLVTFGETMIRLSPPGHRRLEQATTFDVNVGGSELNTAVAAQRLGLNTAYITRLTKNPLGQIVENKAREHRVDTSKIVWTDEDRIVSSHPRHCREIRPVSFCQHDGTMIFFQSVTSYS